MNYAKYAEQFVGVKQGSKKHKQIIDGYNAIKPLPRGYKVKYTDNWCATFVSYVLKMCSCPRKLYECSAQRLMTKCKKYIIEDKTQGQPGDLIFYDWDNNKWCDHVGIIDIVTNNKYSVVEGNKDKKVGVRLISKKSKSIRAVAHIK